MPSNLDDCSRKTCKNDDDDDDGEQHLERLLSNPEYDKFACFCKDTTIEKSDAIKEEQDVHLAVPRGSCYCSCWYQVIDLDGAKS